MTFVIGIAGGTGSGKTTIATRIAEAMAAESVSRIEHDSYYKDRSDLPYEERAALNFDHPGSLETDLLEEHIKILKSGTAVDVPVYDFTCHERSKDVRVVQPTKVVIVEGILVLAHAGLREQMDIKIFVDTAADIRVFRRIRRDIEQRGRDFDSIRRQYYETVRPMHLQFVEPSKQFADIIIPEGGENRVALDLLISKIRSVLAE